MFCISVPVKSNIEFLAGALASLRAQTVPCAVALVDASDDPVVAATADICGLDFAWRRHGPDAGQAAAIAEGWAHTPGDILGWLNDDDMLLSGALDTVAAIFDAEPATDVVYGHGVMLDAEGAFTGYFPSIAADPAGLRHSNVICQPAAFVRRAAVERIGGLDTALHYTMDWDLWLRLYEAGARFRFIDAPLAAVRSHPATKTRAGGAARWREIRRLMAPRLSCLALWRMWLGMRRSDAREAGRVIETALLSALFGALRLGRAPRPASVVLGIDSNDNRIDGRATLVMPASGSDGSVDLAVVADGAASLTARAGAVSIAGVRDPTELNCLFRFAKLPTHGDVLRCDLSSDGGEWRLRRAVVSASVRATGRGACEDRG